MCQIEDPWQPDSLCMHVCLFSYMTGARLKFLGIDLFVLLVMCVREIELGELFVCINVSFKEVMN